MILAAWVGAEDVGVLFRVRFVTKHACNTTMRAWHINSGEILHGLAIDWRFLWVRAVNSETSSRTSGRVNTSR